MIGLSIWLLLAPATPGAVPPRPALPALPAPRTPLMVTRVEREGPPPYDDQDRLYRLEGEGFDKLRPGDILLLRRAQDKRIMSRLEVTLVMPEYALAELAYEGQAFPMRGDLAFVRESLRVLPSLPGLMAPTLARPLPDLQPAAPVRYPPPVEAGFAHHQEPIYFNPGETLLTPAGKTKLQGWVAGWGTAHHWSLVCPPWPGENLDLSAARITVLKDELRRLGVTDAEVKVVLDETPGTFPVIFIEADPW